MEKQFKLSIITPERSVYQGDVFSLVAPAQLGYLGVLANHAPLIANLVAGRVIFRESSGKQQVINSLGKGFLEVIDNNATLLLDDLSQQ